MLESERQLREKLASVLPPKKNISPDRKKPIEGLGLARRSFIEGYQRALKTEKKDISSLFQGANPNAIGFMFEGAGMALTMLDEMNNSEEKYLPILFSGRPESELKLCAIGVGWASARLSKPVGWKPSGISDQWLPAITNGYGFHQGFFNSEAYESNSFFDVDEEHRENFDIGLGRALWFIHEGEIEPIAEFMTNLKPSRQCYLWTGIGIACVFNSDDKKKTTLRELASQNESYLIAGFEKAANLKQELHTAF
ncbi:MAG: DUF1702 family protein [Flavobacteriaceae bacterium]|nr:DUF1702 family protein [Flavobacteriaceae bacterium]